MTAFRNNISLFIIIPLLILFCLKPFSIHGQVKFYASSFTDKISIDEIFEVRFTIENTDFDDFDPPSFKDFEIISGPSRASETTIINGVSKSRTTIIYTLKSTKTGIIILGPAKLKSGKRELKSNRLVFNVGKSPKKDIKSFKGNNSIFIRAELDQKEAFTGQQLMLTYKLYASEKIAGIRNEYEPDFKDFQMQVIDYEFPVQNVTINNRSYSVYMIKNIVLFPMKSGMIHIPPAKFLLEVPDEKSNDIFFQTTKSMHVQTEPINLNVKELPANAPEFYNGLVGKVKLRSKLSSPVQSVQDAFSLIIEIESESNNNTLTAPSIKDYLVDFEVYEPKLIYSDVGIESGKLISRKSYEYAIIPEKTGKQTIKIPYSYFDPQQKQYKTEYTEPINIDVKQRTGTDVSANNKNSEIFPDRVLEPYKKPGKPFFGSILYFIIMALIFISLPVIYYFRFVRKPDPVKLSNLVADKEVKRKLQTAYNYMSYGDKNNFYKEIYDVLINYISEKSGIPAIARKNEIITEKLSEAGIEKAILTEYSDLLKKCEEALFAGKVPDATDEIYHSTARLITIIKSSFKK